MLDSIPEDDGTNNTIINTNVNPTDSNVNTNWSNEIDSNMLDSIPEDNGTFDPGIDSEMNVNFETHDPWGGTSDDYYEEGNFWNKGGQIPNRAGGK